ncbi:MAG: hypothetical protein WBN18_01570 [Flavobacteriaceae bacterium]
MMHYGKKSKNPFLFLLILIGFNSCNTKLDHELPRTAPVDAPKQIIAIHEAKGFYDDYTKRRVPLIQRFEDSINRARANDKMQQMQQAQAEEEPAQFDVARYVYYDYATIKQYLEYIEQEAKMANVEISTLRLYFSNYPDDSQFVHPRQNSIMLSPTLKKGDRDYLFYIGELDGKAEAILLNNDFGPMKADGMGDGSTRDGKSYASIVPSLGSNPPNPAMSLQSGKSLTLNRGNGVPPPYY